MDTGVLVQFNLAKFVLDLDYFSVGLLVLLVASVTWLLSLVMTLRFDVNSALQDVSLLLKRVKKAESARDVDRIVGESTSGVSKSFFDVLAAEFSIASSGAFAQEAASADPASKKFFQRSVFSARDVLVDALCARLDRAVVAGWGVGLLSLCAILVRSLMLVLARGAASSDALGVERWLFAALVFAIIGVWGVCATNWMCGFLKIGLASIDQQLKRLCVRLVFLSEKG